MNKAIEIKGGQKMEKEFDLAELEAEWEKEWQDDEIADESEETVDEDTELDSEVDDENQDEDNAEVDDHEEGSDSDTDDVEETQEETEEVPQTNEELETYKRQLEDVKRQLDETKRTADVFDEIAKQNGVSREELLKQYEAKKLEEDAKAQNVPVEYLQKQRDMERELKELRESQMRKDFNSSVSNLKSKYNLSDDEVRSTLDYAFTNGIDAFNPNINLEAVYKAANFDKILEKQVKETRQKELANKQKRMKSASISHNGSQTDVTPNIDDEVRAFLKEVL